MPLPLLAIGLGAAAFGGAGKALSRAQSNKQIRNQMGKMPGYQIDESIKRRLGLAETLLNARMPGAAAAERNIFQTQANQMANIQRGASSGSDVLLGGAGAAGQANQAFNQLGQMEAADYQRRYGNLAEAQNAMNAEKQREFENRMQRYQMETQMLGAIQANKAATWGDIANFGMGLASFGVNSALSGKGGNMPTLPNSAPSTQAPITFNRNINPGSINVPTGVSNYMANYSTPPAPEYIPQSLVGNWWTR